MVVSDQQNNYGLASLSVIVGLLYVREQHPAKDYRLGNNGSGGGCIFCIRHAELWAGRAFRHGEKS